MPGVKTPSLSMSGAGVLARFGVAKERQSHRMGAAGRAALPAMYPWPAPVTVKVPQLVDLDEDVLRIVRVQARSLPSNG